MPGSDPFPLFHGSPTARRPRIEHDGFRPSSRSVDGLWRPPYVCLSDSPPLAWSLSGQIHPEIAPWDLWMTWSNVPRGFEEIWDHYPDTGRKYVKEYPVYERIWKRDVWYVATRTDIRTRV